MKRFKNNRKLNILDFQSKFKDEDAIIKYYIKIRYNNQLCCNHCKSSNIHPRKNRPKIYQCSNCGKDFSVFKGTIFENSCTDLRKWFYAIHLFINSKKGISGLQLEREIDVTYKTAWRMLKQIRIAMGNRSFAGMFDNIVEIDETYVGGKPKKMMDGTTQMATAKRGRATKKIPVIGVVDRLKKLVYARVALPDADGKKLTGLQLSNVLNHVTKPGTTVMTDEFRSYRILSKLGLNYLHLRIDHSKEFAKGKKGERIHTNGIESFWATLKRGIYGIYHSVSLKYLQNYVDEFCFRYNNKHNMEIFDTLLQQSIC